jgi:hypothetical protein
VEIQRIELPGSGATGGNGTRFRLDKKGLIDLTWAARAHADGLVDFSGGVRREDSAVPLARDLNYVLQYVREQYRPTKYEQVLQTVTVPDWAERWEVSKITGTGNIKLASQIGPRDIVRADISRSTTTGRMFEMVNGYGYSNREMIRSAKLGINPETERATVQREVAAEFCDALAATGLVGTAFADMGLGLTGLGNDANVVAAGLLLGSAGYSTTTSWTASTAADFPLIMKDLHRVTDEVYKRTKERKVADTLVMPLDEFQVINQARPANYSDNALDTFKREWQAKAGKPVRIIVWDRFAAIGSVSSGPRLCAFDSSDTDVACMVVGKPYGVDQVLEVTRGFEVNCSLVTGGVRILNANGVVYLDLAA